MINRNKVNHFIRLKTLIKIFKKFVKNPLKAPKSLIRFYQNKGIAPYYAGIYLTYKCQSRCLTCDIWKYQFDSPTPAFLKNELSTEEVFRLLEDLKKAGTKSVGLFGGDVTTRKDLPAIIKKASSLGVKIGIGYNGINIDQGLAGDLISAGLKSVEVSIDSPIPGLHNEIRGIKIWDRLVGGLNYLDEAKKKYNSDCKIQVNCVISKLNYKDLDKFPDLKNLFNFSDLGFDQYLTTFFRKTDYRGGDSIPLIINGFKDERKVIGGKNYHTLQLNKAEIDYLYKEVIPRLLKKAKEENIYVHNPYPFGRTKKEIAQVVDRSYAQKIYKKTYCFIPWFHTIIAGPYVTICNYSQKKGEVYKIGNLRKQSFLEIWNSKEYQEVRRNCKPPRFEFCKFCSGCRPYNQYVGINRSLSRFFPLKFMVYGYTFDK